MKGVVASGHPLTTKAAIEMFLLGGNAFDAVVSAGFASVVTEPTLTSLGGGGFLLAHIEKEKKDVLFDFFVNTPGLNKKSKTQPIMQPVEIRFPDCTQIFHIGFASAAVPGMLKGLLHIHKRLCTLPLEIILRPALSYLEKGIEINDRQEVFLNLLRPIFTFSDYGRQIYTINGRYVKLRDKLFNPMLQEFFQEVKDNNVDIYSGETARKLVKEMENHNGLITEDDLGAYDVIEREPLRITYRDREILSNPPPSSGGIMMALALSLLGNMNLAKLPRDSEEFFVTFIELMKEIESFKSARKNNFTKKSGPEDTQISRSVEAFKRNISEKIFISTRGTTHISIIDEEGNAASMSTSNGSGSGCFIPGTGIMLNNMMGEDDLHPEGFFSVPPNVRVSSMMIPTMVIKDGKVELVMGSGGSKRIKTAVLQVLINVVDFNYSLREAVEASRIHFEEGTVHIEPDIPERLFARLKKCYKMNLWRKKDMYFGGVHCVNSDMDGWGDSRRGGSFMTVK
jgi:gamma-glutamyltranspeptidase/glutathione hydrolase